MFLLGDIEKIIGATCVAAAVAESGYEPNSPTTSTDSVPPPPTIDMGM